MAATAPAASRAPQSSPAVSGLAHVGALSFLAARLAPPFGFWVALAGGVALARASQRWGARQGYGVSLAAVLEVMAIVGPARAGVALTQALSAPLLGRLEDRGMGRTGQVLVCMAVRFTYNALGNAFFIWVILGGLDAYAGTYDSVLGRLPGVPPGPAAALVATGIGLVAWSVFASVVQVQVYTRGLRGWAGDRGSPPPARSHAAPGRSPAAPGAFDPRAIALAAVIAFAVLLSSIRGEVLAAVAAWLVVAWLAARAESSVLPATLALALLLAAGTAVFTLLGGQGVEETAQRAARAGLLVLIAGWLRGAAGFAGLREVIRRFLGRLRRLPAVPEAAAVLEDLGSAPAMVASARALAGSLKRVGAQPLPVVDAVLSWVAAEAEAFRPTPGAAALRLRMRVRDIGLALSACLPALAFFSS